MLLAPGTRLGPYEILAPLGAGGMWLLLSKRAQAPDVATMRPAPLTSYLGDERQASLSPDGNQVVFSWNGEKGDNADIYVKVVGPGAPLRLTTYPGFDFSPRWSPDGRSIAFARLAAEGG